MDFWGWILAVAGITIIIQIITIVYCLKVYVTNLFASDSEDEEDAEQDLTPTSFNEKNGMSPASPTPSNDHEMVPQKVSVGLLSAISRQITDHSSRHARSTPRSRRFSTLSGAFSSLRSPC